jgi:hypothetical protein
VQSVRGMPRAIALYMTNSKSRIVVEIEVRPNYWVTGNAYRSLDEARLALAAESWRIKQ